MEQTLNFDVVSGIKTITDNYSQLDEAYLVAHLGDAPPTNERRMNDVVRLEGMAVLLVKSGHAEIEIDMERFQAQGPSICVVHSASTLFFGESKDIQISILFLSQRFLQNININMSAFNLPTMLERHTPVLGISSDEMNCLDDYFRLLERNCADGASRQLAMSVGSSLVSALVYEMAKMQYRRINAPADDNGGRAHSARNGYVADFIKLVRAHYATERSVAFYASKLFISPKYLSLVVREATGRSAARWIDEFVLMEAKNMLRYSGKNIQQVAYALNFSNQSSFGKYFKHLTGMSPTEYQKS